jgi:hypothetical protein
LASGSLSEESVAKDKEYHTDMDQGNEGTRERENRERDSQKYLPPPNAFEALV